MIGKRWHRREPVAPWVLLAILCLGFATFGMVGTSEAATISNVHAMHQHADYASTTDGVVHKQTLHSVSLKHAHQDESATAGTSTHSHHGESVNAAAPSYIDANQAHAGHANPCENPCELNHDCSAVCALACAAATASAVSACAVSPLAHPAPSLSVLPWRSADNLLSMVLPPLFRPPII